MPQRASWRSLGIGLIGTGAVLAAALLILIFGRVGTIHGRKFTLYVLTDAARGVIRGTEVWLDGRRVGSVETVGFIPSNAGTKDGVVLNLRLLEGIREHIRRDSRVAIQAGSSIIGEQVVYITSGTARQPAVRNADTLHGAPQSDLEGMTSDAAIAAREFPGILENIKLLAAQLQSTENAIGAFGIDGGVAPIARLRVRVGRLAGGVTGGRGTVGLALANRNEFVTRVTRARAQLDSVRMLLESGHHSLGRFRRDSTLMRDVARIRDEIEEVRRLSLDPSGTIGRLRTDSAIVRGIHRDLAALDSLIADMKKHPLRYIAF